MDFSIEILKTKRRYVMITDTHAHYDDEAFDEDRDELLSNFEHNGVELVVNASANLKGCRETLKLMKRYPKVYGMLGVHPSEVEELSEETLSWIKNEAMANSINSGGKVVAVGEIGLDYHYPEPTRDIQKLWFERQLEVAREIHLPVNIHSRDAAQDTMDILKAHDAGSIGGIIHCYSYSREMARDYLNMDFFFGIGGVVTFKNARKTVEAVEYIPIDHIVLETDAPYLAPTPYRGERNDSSRLSLVASKIAEIKGITADEVIRITGQNAGKVYGINANA